MGKNIPNKAKQEKKKIVAGYVKNLKKNATKSELIFKTELERQGVKFLFQHPIVKSYVSCILDFYIPAYPQTIVVEIDGGYHLHPDQQKKDAIRDRWLTQDRNHHVLRFTNEEVEADVKECVKMVRSLMLKRSRYKDRNPIGYKDYTDETSPF